MLQFLGDPNFDQELFVLNNQQQQKMRIKIYSIILLKYTEEPDKSLGMKRKLHVSLLQVAVVQVHVVVYILSSLEVELQTHLTFTYK